MQPDVSFTLKRFASFILWPLITASATLHAHDHESSVNKLEFANGVRMELLEESGQFLGIGRIEVDGMVLRTSDRPVFPLVAADWSFPEGLYTDLRLAEVNPLPNGWELVIELRQTQGEAAWEPYFLFDADGAIERDPFFLARVAPVFSAKAEGVLSRGGISPTQPVATPPAGYLIWRIEADGKAIAGWTWKGWRWSFSGELTDGAPLNAFRLLSSWALDGSIDGLTLANQRYRGLGFPSQTFTDTGSGSTSAWNTQDLVLPGEWKGRSAKMDRQTALDYHRESWIHVPARGAGHGFIDYQYRSEGALAAFPERQGNLRSLTEVYPGDPLPGQLDEEHFETTRDWETTPYWYLFLTTNTNQPDSFWQTRYLELEQAIRTEVAAELGFVETPVLPTVGALFDFWRPGDGFAQVVARLGAHAGRWSELGVRRIMVHNPGWKNGRAAKNAWDGATRDEYIGGSVNTVYDWWPLPEVESAWKQTHAALQTLGIEYFIWISGITHRDADFHQRVGPDPAAWASNHPDGSSSPIYGETALKHNILSPDFREAFNERLTGVRREFGYEGYWGDSFQNLFMSQFDWRGHKGKPQQRAWWEWVSAQTRDGLGWIGESQSFPGLSCSIETDGWDRQPWLLGSTIKWLRGYDQWDRTPERWMPVAYRLMAFNAWLAPETWMYEVTSETQPDSVIADFGRLANEFLAAKPDMVRPYVLPEGKGVLWLPAGDSDRGVLFPFKRQKLPESVRGRGILDTHPMTFTGASPWQTMTVHGNDLLDAFDLPKPPAPDGRMEPEEGEVTVETSMVPEHPPVLQYHPVPGKHATVPWDSDSRIWKAEARDKSMAWPGRTHRAFFPAARRVVLPIEGHVQAAGIQTVSPGVEFVIDTLSPSSQLELGGPLLGPATVYFKGTVKEDGWPHTELRRGAGLKFSGGGIYDLEADLLPWPEQRHHHSQLITLEDPGTTVHFRGYWDATGELARPGLVLDDGTRFVIWPEARMSFIKDYGGFTLQLWVTGAGEEGGVLELHPEFKADRSRIHVSTTQPRAADLVPDAIGSIRMGGATLISHDSRNLPITGRAMCDEADSIQNNGHLVFEHRGTNRWIVRTRDQLYRGAVWIDHDVEIVTEKNLTLEGITEAPDRKFHYTAANAFQTRRKRHTPETVTIRKGGPATLLLKGEQAYVSGSVLRVEEGLVAFHTDPAAGFTFPKGDPQTGIHLQVAVADGATVSWAVPTVRLNRLEASGGSRLEWNTVSVVEVSEAVGLNGTPVWNGDALDDEQVLLIAPDITRNGGALPQGWSIRPDSGKMVLTYNPNPSE